MRQSILGALAALLLAACGSSSNSFDDDGSLGGPGSLSSCQASFDPAKVADGQDCAPVAGTYCPSIHYSGEPRPQGQTIPCDGVAVDEVMITTADYTTQYLAIRRSSGTPESVVLNLHYLGAPIRVNANQLRLNELAIARNALILVPQAPDLSSSILPPGTITLPTNDLYNPFLPGVPLVDGGTTTLSRWPNSIAEANTPQIEALLDAVVSDGRNKFGGGGKPLYVSGYSNGAVMGLRYACDRVGSVRAVLAVGSNLEKTTADACDGVGVVFVQGTNDALAPYDGSPPFRYGMLEAYSVLKSINGCGSDSTAVIPDEGPLGGIPIDFLYTGECATGKRFFAVTAENGGHTWPSQDNDTAGLDFATFGAIARSWDATLYGYDLLRLAGG